MGTDVKEGLVLHFKVDEGRGNVLHDSSGRYNHGIICGAKWVETEAGKALLFDGKDDFVCVPSRIQGRTVLVWFKTTARKGGFLVHNAKSWSGCWPNYRYALTLSKRGRPSAIVGDGRRSICLAAEAKALNTGQWFCLALVIGKGAIRLYVNGEMVAEKRCRIAPVTAQFFTIGAEYNSFHAHLVETGKKKPEEVSVYGGHFAGIIGEVKVWERPLAPEELRREFEASRFYRALGRRAK